MTHKQYNELLNVGPERQKIILPSDLSSKKDRTLALGFLNNNNVLHTYMRKNCIHVMHYKPKNHRNLRISQTMMIERNTNRFSIHENHTYVDSANLIPEVCDFEFMTKLCQEGVTLHFCSWNSHHININEKVSYYGAILEEII